MLIVSTLVEGIRIFRPQNRILHAKISPGVTSRGLETRNLLNPWTGLKTTFLKIEFLIIEANFTFPDLWKWPRGDFCMQNSILRSKNANSFNQGRTIRKQKFQKPINYLFEMFNPIFSTLVEGISYFWPQNRILRVKILPGVTSRGLETWNLPQIWEIYV